MSSEDDLRSQTTQTLRRVESALGIDSGLPADASDSDCRAAATQSLSSVRTAGDPRASTLIPELELLAARWREELLIRRLRALEGVVRLSTKLEPTVDVREVWDSAASLFVSALGFERVMIFAVHGKRLVASATQFRDAADWAAHCHDFAAEHPIELAAGRLEREVLRRGVGAYVRDAMRDPRTAHPITTETRTNSYVSIPVLAEGRLLGVVNADLHFSDRPVGDSELESATIFTESLGNVWARAKVFGQLRDLQAQTSAAAAGSCIRDDRHSPSKASSPGPRVPVTVGPIAPSSRPHAFEANVRLTSREVEVLDLLTTGARNRQIASALHVTEGTIKTHVAHIMQKFDVATRGEAVAHYLRGVL